MKRTNVRQDDEELTTGALVCLGALQSDPTTTASSLDSTLLHN